MLLQRCSVAAVGHRAIGLVDKRVKPCTDRGHGGGSSIVRCASATGFLSTRRDGSRVAIWGLQVGDRMIVLVLRRCRACVAVARVSVTNQIVAVLACHPTHQAIRMRRSSHAALCERRLNSKTCTTGGCMSV